MRTRYLGYVDYGISEEERKELFRMCRSTDKSTEQALMEAVHESNKAIAEELYQSLHDGVSFEHLDAVKGLLPVSKEDFYAYRRQALYLFKEKMMARNKAVVNELEKVGYIRRYCSIKDAAKEIQITEYGTRRIAKEAGALVKIGKIYRINMIVLYQFIDNKSQCCSKG